MPPADSCHIPFDLLNVQRVFSSPDRSFSAQHLSFAAPEPSLAAAFLSLVALNEGHQIPPASLTDLYDRSSSKPYPAWMLQQQMGTSRRAGGGGFGARPLAPDTSTQPLVSRDLRKALMQLEVECQRGRGSGQAPSAGRVEICEGPVGLAESEQRAREEGSELSGPGGLEQAALAVDALSWADAYVDRRIEVMIEVRGGSRRVIPDLHRTDRSENCRTTRRAVIPTRTTSSTRIRSSSTCLIQTALDCLTSATSTRSRQSCELGRRGHGGVRPILANRKTKSSRRSGESAV